MDFQQKEDKLQGGQEDEPYSLENIPVIISVQEFKVSLPNCIFQIREDGFTILIQKPNEQWVTIFTAFANTTSIGVSGTNLLIFVGDMEEQQLEEEPEILMLIRQAKPCNLNLTGNCFIVELFLNSQGKNVQKELNDILTNYMGDANDNQSRYDQDEDFQQMISANDIDENGNIIDVPLKNQEEQEDQSGQQDFEEEVQEVQLKK